MNKEVPKGRMHETLQAYGIDVLHIPLVINYFEHLLENQREHGLSLMDIFANFFEISSDWLNGSVSEVTVPVDDSHSLQQFILHLIHCKRSGWKPKIVFVKSVAATATHSEHSFLIFIELLKITKTGIAFTVFAPWSAKHFEMILLLCQKVGLYYRGLNISGTHFQALQHNQLLPYEALHEPLSLWHPETELKIPHDYHLEENHSFIEELSFGAIEPTYLA